MNDEKLSSRFTPAAFADGLGSQLYTVRVPPALKARLAVAALMGVLLIPVIATSMRGLGHILVCEEQVESKFTIIASEGKSPQILSAATLEPGEDFELCNGLLVDLRGRGSENQIQLIVLITNNSPDEWRGTVHLGLTGKQNITLPVGIGRVGPGETESDSIDIRLQPGTTEIGGSLFIGP